MSTAMEIHVSDIEHAARQALASGYFEYLTKGKSLDQAVKDAVVIVAKGRELGIPPLFALQKLYAIPTRNGTQITTAVEVMIALVARSKVVTWGVLEEDDTHCKYNVCRHDLPFAVEYAAEFSVTDAKRLGLIREGGPWQTQPKTMCRRRAAALAFREICPDIVQGMYAFDELGVQTIMDPQDWTKETPVIGDEGMVVDPDVIPPAEEEVDQVANGEFTAPMTPEELHRFSEDLKGLWGNLKVDKANRPGILADALKPFNTTVPGELTLDQGTAVLVAIRNSLGGEQQGLGVG